MKLKLALLTGLMFTTIQAVADNAGMPGSSDSPSGYTSGIPNHRSLHSSGTIIPGVDMSGYRDNEALPSQLRIMLRNNYLLAAKAKLEAEAEAEAAKAAEAAAAAENSGLSASPSIPVDGAAKDQPLT